jgi:hypothetical protein
MAGTISLTLDGWMSWSSAVPDARAAHLWGTTTLFGPAGAACAAIFPNSGPAVLGTSRDGGATWSPSSGFAQSLKSYSGRSHDGQVWFVSNDGGGAGSLHWSSDWGATWTQGQTLGKYPTSGLNFQFASRSDGWLGTSAIFHTRDGGKTWQLSLQMGTGGRASLCAFWVADSLHVWAVGAMDGVSPEEQGQTRVEVYHTSDGGATWKLAGMMDIAGVYVPKIIYFADSSHGYVGGIHPEYPVLSSSDGGHTWGPTKAPITGEVFDIDVASMRSGMILGSKIICTAQVLDPMWTAMDLSNPALAIGSMLRHGCLTSESTLSVASDDAIWAGSLPSEDVVLNGTTSTPKMDCFVAPSPARTWTRFQVISPLATEGTITICDVLGRTQFTAPIHLSGGGANGFKVNVTNFVPGCYLARINTSLMCSSVAFSVSR